MLPVSPYVTLAVDLSRDIPDWIGVILLYLGDVSILFAALGYIVLFYSKVTHIENFLSFTSLIFHS